MELTILLYLFERFLLIGAPSVLFTLAAFSATNGAKKPIGTLLSGPLTGAIAGPLPAPCRVEGTADAQSRFLRPCEAFQTELSQEVSDKTRTHITALYQGKRLDPLGGPNSLGFPFGKPVCNLTPGLFNENRAEVTTNHLGEACGPPILFEFDTQFKLKGGLQIETTIHFDSVHGKRESSYLQ